MKCLLLFLLLIIVIKTEAQITYDHVIYAYDQAGNRNMRYKIITLNKRNNDDTIFQREQKLSAPASAGIANIQVYPNPIKDMLNIDTEEPSPTGIISIVDAKGSTQYVKKEIDNKNLIDLSFLHSGFYLIKLNFNGNVRTYSFIKQ